MYIYIYIYNIYHQHLICRVLYEVGCLTSCLEDSEVTELGRVAVHMPIDLPLVRLVLLGRAFGCMNDAIVMAAALSLQVDLTVCMCTYIHMSGTKWNYTSALVCNKTHYADCNFTDVKRILCMYT